MTFFASERCTVLTQIKYWIAPDKWLFKWWIPNSQDKFRNAKQVIAAKAVIVWIFKDNLSENELCYYYGGNNGQKDLFFVFKCYIFTAITIESCLNQKYWQL